MTFAIPGSTYGLNAPSHPSGNSFVPSDGAGSRGGNWCQGSLGTVGVCIRPLAKVVMRLGGSSRYNMRPSRPWTVTIESDLPETSTEIVGKYTRRTLIAPTMRSVLFVRSTATGATACSAAPPWYRLSPAQAQNGIAHSPIDAVRKAMRIANPPCLKTVRLIKKQTDSPKVPATVTRRIYFSSSIAPASEPSAMRFLFLRTGVTRE